MKMRGEILRINKDLQDFEGDGRISLPIEMRVSFNK